MDIREVQDNQIVAEIEEPEQLAHLSASHSNALVENPFD
ncbi:streptamidine family RiPP [Saccharomonospora sp. CUA-673]|nr:streptamidine family RiPP [Saccharomonospora sp. CUA-673]